MQHARRLLTDERAPVPKRSVIVIGAGVAGLKAVQELAQDPALDVRCFEANDYVGGRVRTLYEDGPDGTPISSEYGAAWIHGEERGAEINPILTLARDLGIQLVATPSMGCVRCDGTSADFSSSATDYFQLVWGLFHQLELDAHLALMAAGEVKSVSVIDYSIRMSETLFKHIQEHLMADVIRVYRQFQNNYAVSFEEMNAASFAIMKEFHGEHHLLVQGYTELVARLLRRHSLQHRISLRHTVLGVERVAAAGAQRFAVRVRTPQGAEEVHFCEYVVLAVPLGVLKAGSIALSADLFPPAVHRSIARVGFGKFEKIFVDYDVDVDGIWPVPSTNYLIVTPSDSHDVDAFAAQEHFGPGEQTPFVPYYERNASEVGMEIVNLKGLYGINRLVVLFYDKHADVVAQLSARQDWDGLRAFVNPLLQRAFRTSVDVAHVRGTDWAANERFLGSFSFIPLDCVKEDLDVFTRMYDGAVIAGEHSSVEYISTVHGAYVSGARAAAQIQKHSNSTRR